MKVLGINGSARAGGNTEILLQTVFAVLGTYGIATERISLAGETIAPCKACFACGGKGNCMQRQDAFSDIFAKMAAADGILLGSPVYSANVSANMQALLERAAVVLDGNPGLFQRKVGAAVAAVRRGGGLAALDAMCHFFLNHEMFAVGSTYWNMAYGQLPGDVQKDREGMETMRNLGHNMAFLLQKLAPHPLENHSGGINHDAI